jgi:RNA polymerase sigma-70 factor (ECF subfamily)
MRPADRGSEEQTDEALMLAYALGDASAFERLYARHKGPTYRYFLRHTSERAIADELQQDVWLKVVRARERYAPDARFATWLYTLARHRLVDHWRAQHGTRFVSLDDDNVEHADAMRAAGDTGDDRSDPLGQVIDGQAGRRLLQALDDVPAPNVPAETIKSRLRYAYRRLRAALEDLQ